MSNFDTREKLLFPDAGAARHYGRNGGKSAARASASVWTVEGEALTIKQIAHRLNCSEKAVHYRVAYLRKNNKPITWEGLKR